MRTPNDLLKILDDYELDIFTDQSFKKVTHKKLRSWIFQLRTLIRNGLIDIIEKGKYCRHNFRNEYITGNYLSPDSAIAYWTALNLHGLTEQFANTIFVQTASQKKDKSVFGVEYKFIKVKHQKLTGIEQQGYGNNQFRITDKEKTIIDCFDLPQYSGGYSELIHAFAKTKLDNRKMIDYCEAVNNIAVIKRLGYLTDLFKNDKLSKFKNYALSKVNKRYSLFDPLGINEGQHISKWRLRLNITEDNILNMTNNLY